MTVEVFGKQVELREYDCAFYDNEPRKMQNNRANLFVTVTNECNANCKFCTYHTECNRSGQDFNYAKFTEVLAELDSKVTLKKLNFTGGEPTLDINRFERILTLCKDNIHSDKLETTVNTNGIHLLSLIQYQDYIDSIGLSRHHFDDESNKEIFGCNKIATQDDILEFQRHAKNPYLLHSRCNLIKGYIDNTDKIILYLENCSKLDIRWAGFVTLMPLNNFCIDNEVCASDLIKDEVFYRNQLWSRQEAGETVCRCADYLYISDSGKMIKFYNRIFCNCNLSAGQFVYDGQHLRLGFSGEIIY